ncbi:hypothetical protein L1049_028269 [Liquidambar formosana]|uniref:non-specific serine/threonine protein kinase n=1 Tax=Liquidambar formosana TaxID=63359 RepID=A0AAP0WWS2_LIQFO
MWCRGYMAPEYVVHGHLTEKADVYSFGVLILEIMSGQRCSNGLGAKPGQIFLAKDDQEICYMDDDPEGTHKSLPIILGSALVGFLALTLIGIWKAKGYLGRSYCKSSNDSYGSGLSISTYLSKLNFRYKELRRANNNFDSLNKLGQGSYGSVYKGVLPDGREVAVKQLFLNTRQWVDQFFNEVNLISQVRHKNLVKLLGCSVDGPESLLVYKYYFNKSLDHFIFDENQAKLLDWQKRIDIIQGVAEGLCYLHEESEIRIIHRDIKASNILLDDKLEPKITDFGLARSFTGDQTHLSTGIAGTL